MDISALGEHLLVALVPWFVGVIVGGSLGYGSALAVRGLFLARPVLRRLSVLLPWRTIAMTLLLLSPVVPALVGLGTVTGTTIVMLFVLVFALPFTASALLERWFPTTPTVRLAGGIRTLAVASVAAARLAPSVAGGGGAGAIFFQGWRPLDYSQTVWEFATVVLSSLTIDLFLGALQFLLSRTRNRSSWGKARMTNHANPMPPGRG